MKNHLNWQCANNRYDIQKRIKYIISLSYACQRGDLVSYAKPIFVHTTIENALIHSVD